MLSPAWLSTSTRRDVDVRECIGQRISSIGWRQSSSPHLIFGLNLNLPLGDHRQSDRAELSRELVVGRVDVDLASLEALPQIPEPLGPRVDKVLGLHRWPSAMDLSDVVVLPPEPVDHTGAQAVGSLSGRGWSRPPRKVSYEPAMLARSSA